MPYYAKFKAGGTRKTFLRHSAYKIFIPEIKPLKQAKTGKFDNTGL